MTVAELIEKLKEMPQDAEIYAEGERADKVVLEGYDSNGNHREGWAKVVRIIKAWDVNFVGLEDVLEQIKEQTNGTKTS